MVRISFILRRQFNLKYYVSEFLKKFIGGDKAEIPENISFPEQIKKLTDGLDLINAELKQKIRNDYPNLIKHSANASK